MRNRTLLMVLPFSLIILFALTWSLRSHDQNQTQRQDILRIGGSLTIANLVKSITDDFQKQNSVQVNDLVEDQSSGRGIGELLGGEIDIARSSRSLNEAEMRKGLLQGHPLRSYQLGYDAIAIVANLNSKAELPSLSLKQVEQIFFESKIRDWSQINPKLHGRMRIVVQVEVGGSGTSEVFKEKLGLKSSDQFRQDAIFVHSYEEREDALRTIEGSVSFVSYASAPHFARVFPLQNAQKRSIQCNPESVKSGSYPLSRELYVITDDRLSLKGFELIEFALGEFGQRQVAKDGFIPVRDGRL